MHQLTFINLIENIPINKNATMSKNVTIVKNLPGNSIRGQHEMIIIIMIIVTGIILIIIFINYVRRYYSCSSVKLYC